MEKLHRKRGVFSSDSTPIPPTSSDGGSHSWILSSIVLAPSFGLAGVACFVLIRMKRLVTHENISRRNVNHARSVQGSRIGV